MEIGNKKGPERWVTVTGDATNVRSHLRFAYAFHASDPVSGPEEDIPDTLIDLFQPDVFAGAADADPVVIPAAAACPAWDVATASSTLSLGPQPSNPPRGGILLR